MFDHRGKQIYLICGSTDMRKGIDGLSSIVDLRLVCSSFESAMVIFCNRSRNRVRSWSGIMMVSGSIRNVLRRELSPGPKKVK